MWYNLVNQEALANVYLPTQHLHGHLGDPGGHLGTAEVRGQWKAEQRTRMKEPILNYSVGAWRRTLWTCSRPLRLMPAVLLPTPRRPGPSLAATQGPGSASASTCVGTENCRWFAWGGKKMDIHLQPTLAVIGSLLCQLDVSVSRVGNLQCPFVFSPLTTQFL